jgi:hypothetical protein
MALTLDQLFPQSGQPTQPTRGLTLDQLFPPVPAVESEPVIEEKPESGFWAHLKKSFSDAYDYISLASLGLDGAEGNEEEIARIVAETTRRQDEVAKSAQHQYLLDVVGRESKDVKDAEGFANTSLAVLDAAGKTIWTAVTNPLGVAEFGASQAGNMAVAVGGMFAGGLAGIPGGPLGIAIGSRVGAGTAGASVETGAAYIEALMKAGIDVTNQAAVQKAISDPEFQREMYKKGYTKGLTIGLVDAAFMGLSKLPGTGAGRELRKDLLKEGIDIKKNADWEKIAVRHAEGDEVVTAAFKKYADAPRAKAIGTKKMAIETIGEGVGEGLGGLAAFGETSFEDIALEMLGSTAQSGVQAAVSASLSGSKQLLQKATKESLRQQADAVHKGKASGIEPEELNEALRRQKDGVSAQLDTVSEPIAAFEEDIGKADNAQSVVDSLRTALTLEGFANYRLSLQTALQTEDAYPNGVMPFYAALTKEEQATLAAGGSLSTPIKGSLSRGRVNARKGKTDKKGQNFGGQDVVLVKVPVSSVIMRGNWDNVELVVAPNGMQLAAVPQTPQQTETKPILSQKLEQEADRLARQDVETTLDTEVEIGELETQATDRSKKDVDLDTREATDKAARKLAQLREPDNYETVSQLQGALDRNKIPLFPGQRRKRPPLALALQNYRKALTKPNSADAINDVLAPTGYKLSKKADGVHLIPIDNKPALRVPNTGNREVGQSTVDDYLFWINEGQATKAPETTEKKQAALKKEAAQVEARKPPRENVQSIIDSIENNFVTRDGDKITVDEEGLSDILAQAGNIADWSKADKGRLNQYVRSIRTEQELQTPTKKAPVKGTTITVPQSAGALTSLESSFKRTGKSKFIERVRKLLTNKKGNDALLAEIAKAYRKANPGKADGDLASILTLTGKADQANIAKAYALAQMLITLRPSVSTIRPDTTLAIEDGNLSAFMRFDKVLDGVKENQLVGQIKQVFGEDSTYTRINDFEVVVTNPKLTPIQFARRFGRLRGKRNDIRKSELFTAQIETQTHDWTKDPSGESIRSEIRRLGFGSILQYVDDRRADYLDIAEEFGAKEVAQYRQAPRAPPQETATEEDTESTDEVDFSLESQSIESQIRDIEAQIAELDPESESGLIEELISQRNFLLEEEGVALFALGERKKRRIGEGKDTEDKTTRHLEDLEKTIPESERTARTSRGKRKTVDGGDYLDLNLDQAGKGMLGLTQEELTSLWEASVGDTSNSEAAREIISKLNMAPKGVEFWDDALRLPDRARYWYEVSAESFEKILRVSKGDLKRFIAIVSATSPQANPIVNMKRAIGVFAQYMAGEPIDMDLTIPQNVREALKYGTLSGLKTGSFAGTMQYILGLENTAPLSTNDRQVASSFGVTGDDIATNPILYETLSRFYINLRDKLNSQLPPGAEPFETWQLQALGWVEERATSEATDTTRDQTDDYLSALQSEDKGKRRGVIPILKSAGIIENDFLTEDDLRSPAIPSALSGTLDRYRSKQKLTIEMGSPFSDLQAEAKALAQEAFKNNPVAAREFLETFTSVLYASGRGVTNPFNELVSAITGKKTTLTRLQAPTSESPFDIAGTYEGEVSPNVRVPMPANMADEDIQVVMAVIGRAWKQAAMAHSNFQDPAVSEGVETHSVFVETTENLGADGALFGQFSSALPDGHEVIIERWPNGYMLHVTPSFTDEGPVSLDVETIDTEATKTFGDTTKLMSTIFSGDYIEAEAYGKIISRFRNKLRQDIRKFEAIKDGNITVSKRDHRTLQTKAEASARRLDNLDSAIRKANKLQQEFEKRQRQWVEKYRKRLSPEAASLTPIDKPASGGFSASGLRQALVSKFGEKGIARLEADGILVIVESAADLPAGLIKDQDAAQRARGLFDPKTQTAYLIANRLNRVTAPKVLLHEVGTHFGLKRMIGGASYAELILELDAGKETTFKPWYDRIRANYGGRVNEGTDRFAEEVLAAIAEDTSEITLPLRTRIWRAVKNFLFGAGLPKNLTPQEIGYVIQGSLRKAMRQNNQLPGFMRMEGGDVQLGRAAIAFPEYTAPTRSLTQEHRRYDIISAVDKVLTRSEELRLRRNMDGMMKVAERVYKKGYKNIDVHLPVVSPNTSITSRYAMFKNTQTGTELVIRMSDHAKDPFVAAGSFPFVSYNNGHKTDMTDLSEIERAVKLLSTGKLDGMNGLEFQFEYSFGDGVAGVSKANSQKFTYQQFLKALQKKNPSLFTRVQENAQMELRSGAVIGEEGPVFSLNRNSGLDAESKAAINATTGGNARRSAGELVSDARNGWWQKRVQNWVDAYRPIKNLLGDQATRAWQMMQLSENSHGMLHAMLHYGAPKARYHNGQFDWYDVDFSKEGLLDILKDLDGEADRFMAWMVYTRANRLAAEEREKNFTDDQIKAGLKLNRQSENDMMKSGRDRRVVYQKAMRKMSKLQESVLQMAVDAGVIDETVRENLSTDFYVPFYREFTSDGKTATRGPTPAHDFVNIKSVINRLRGSEENINDALQNMMMNWTSLMSAAMKNRAGVAAMEAATNAGAAKLLTNKKDIANIQFSKGKSRNEKFDSFVYVLKDGKRVWYEVSDPLVLNAMSSLAWGGVDSKALRTLSTFKRWLTIGVTASPAFKIRNMIRDTVHSIAVGKLSYNGLGNASTGYQTLKDNHLVTADMMMGGAIFQFGFYNDDPAAIRRMVDAVGEGRIINTTRVARKVLGGLFGWYQDIGNRMENANRASLYLQRKEEVGHLQASMEARDLLNFSQHGRGVAAQWLMASLPFLQARINGLDKLARSGAKGERARLLTVVGTVTLASILLRLSYEGDEDYDELEEWQKDTYWPIKIPGTKDFFFLPKPFEIGAIASMGERVTENFIRDMGEQDMDKYTSLRIRDLLMHQLAVDWRPQIVKPMIELWQNKNAFTDRQIENIYWQMNNLPKDMRVRAYTSDFSIKSSWAVGEMLDVIGLKESGLHISPVQMDHLIKGYFGWIGATTTGAFDILSSDVDPLTRVDELRGLIPAGSFYSGSPRKATKYLTLFYEQMGEVKGLKSTYDSYKRNRMADEAKAVVAENRDVMRWLGTYTRANKAMQKINKQIGFIYDDKDMSPADKRNEIDRLNELKVGIAKKIVLIRAEREDEEGIKSDNPLASLRSEN